MYGIVGRIQESNYIGKPHYILYLKHAGPSSLSSKKLYVLGTWVLYEQVVIALTLEVPLS